MAIWKIPNDYIIDWSPSGDDVKTFSRKVKYCLEEAFTCLNELHNVSESIVASIVSVDSALETIVSNTIGGIPVEISSIQGGDILVYREADQKFHNSRREALGEAKSLIIYNGADSLVNYNGSETATLDLQSLFSDADTPTKRSSTDFEHLARLVENLYLTLDVAELNPGGYDGLSGETFYGRSNDIDTTIASVTSVLQGSNTIIVNSASGLIEGSNYLLTDGTSSSWVTIEQISTDNGINTITLKDNVTDLFTVGATSLIRSAGILNEGYISGNNSFFTTNPISFINEITGEATAIRRAHFIVKHQNVADTEITAEIALRPTATFIKGEVIGVGTGYSQVGALAHDVNLTQYKFALYFDGIKQTNGFLLDLETGEVIFLAPEGTIVSVDYFYNWSEEIFVEMEKTGTYQDRRNPNRATTQFTYVSEDTGKIATLRLKLNQLSGTAINEISTVGTGTPQAFKLAHQAIDRNAITVTPSTATVGYSATQNIVVVTAANNEAITISYNWRGKSLKVDSFVCMFDE